MGLCFKKIAPLALLAFAVSCGQNGVAPLSGSTITINGDVTTIAGDGNTGSGDGTGASAHFNYPGQMCITGTTGYITDRMNCTIRKINLATYAVTTVAGTAGSCAFADGTGSAAGFAHPHGCTIVGSYMYITDAVAHKIRRMNLSSYAVDTFAGSTSGNTDATGTSAQFDSPSGIVSDGTNLYVTDGSNHEIRKIVISSKVVTTIAGSGASGNADGTGTAATFNNPLGLSLNGTTLYITDYSAHNIRKMNLSTGVVTTIAGTANSSGSADGTGTAATFNNPADILYLGGLLYIADYTNDTIRVLDTSSNDVVTFLGTAGAPGIADGNGTDAAFVNPQSISFDGSALYIVDAGNQEIRKVQ